MKNDQRLRVMEQILAFNRSQSESVMTLSRECWSDVYTERNKARPAVDILRRGFRSDRIAEADTWDELATVLADAIDAEAACAVADR